MAGDYIAKKVGVESAKVIELQGIAGTLLRRASVARL